MSCFLFPVCFFAKLWFAVRLKSFLNILNIRFSPGPDPDKNRWAIPVKSLPGLVNIPLKHSENPWLC